MILKYNITKYDNNIRDVLSEKLGISSRLITKLKHNNQIYINGKSVLINYPISLGDLLEVNLDFIEDNSNIVPINMPLNILYEDDAILVINKPAGIPTHPSMLHYENSISNGIRYYFDSIGLKRKIRPINRLDKDTSGIILFAKNEYIQEHFIRQMKEGSFKKEYLAIVDGDMSSLKKRNY